MDIQTVPRRPRPAEARSAAVTTLTDAQKATLKHNIQLCRDTIVFFTASPAPRACPVTRAAPTTPFLSSPSSAPSSPTGAPIVPMFYDEAGHRVATQYLLSV
jgi:hypothetical protein